MYDGANLLELKLVGALKERFHFQYNKTISFILAISSCVSENL